MRNLNDRKQIYVTGVFTLTENDLIESLVIKLAKPKSVIVHDATVIGLKELNK